MLSMQGVCLKKIMTWKQQVVQQIYMAREKCQLEYTGIGTFTAASVETLVQSEFKGKVDFNHE